MKKELIALYKTLFFTLPNTTPTLKTYAIVDSARDKSLREKVTLSGLNFVDLWHEEMFELEQERPLYLVELKEDNVLLDYLLTQHKESVATYFISPYDLETLQRYYSPFTYVQIEETQGEYAEALFGFYDPNILPNYIQTLHNETKIDEFFAGVGMWLSPSVEHEEELYLAFRDKEGNVEDVNIQLSPLIKEENPRLNFEDASLPTQPNLEAYAHEVTIDHTQMQEFDRLQKETFVKASLQMYHAQGYSHITATQTRVEAGLKLMHEAAQAGIGEDTTLQRYMLLGLLLDAPLYAYAFHKEIVQAVTEEEKAEVLAQLLWKLEKQRRSDDQQ